MDSLGVLVCTIVAVVAIVAIMIANGRAAAGKAKMLNAAHEGYQRALEELRKKPNDPQVKQRALDLGRAYANLTREQKGVTIFDEMALMNDINAATAAAAVAAPTASPSTVEERLKRLDELRTKGLVTEAEYNTRRQAILGEL